MVQTKIKKKKCFFCLGYFTTYKNFDYCQGCAVNGSRYLAKNCPKKNMDRIIKPKKKNTKIYDSDKNLSFWEQVNQQAQSKIYLTTANNIPFQNIPLITESYRYEDKQQKKVGLFLDRDADYRSLLLEYEDDYGENLPELEKASEEIAYEYLFLVVKSLIRSLKDFSVHKEEYYTKLF